jgi:PAS domain S-box-containing protein
VIVLRYIRQIVVFLLLLVVCGLLLWSVYADIEAKTIAQVNAEQMVHAGQAAEGIENFFSAYSDSLSFLARNEHIIAIDDNGRDLMRDFYDSHEGEISSVTRVNEQGVIAYTYPVESSTGADISSQPHVREMMDTQGIVISDVFTSVQGFQTVAFHMPIFANGTFRGSIAVLIPFDTLTEDSLGAVRVIDSGYAWAISRSGVVLFSPYPEQIGRTVHEIFRNSSSVTAMVASAVNGSQGVAVYTVGGELGQPPARKYQAVYLPVTMGNTSWSVIVSTPEDEILSTITGFRNNLLGISALLILSLLVFTYYITRARGIVREEEQRKKAEDALRESEEFNRDLVENLPDIIAIYDRNGIVRFANQAGLQILGSDATAVIGQPILTFVPDEQKAGLEEKMRQRLSGMDVPPYEMKIQTGSGEVRAALLQAVPITYRNEPVILILMTDITELKKKEQALYENEQRLASIYNTVGDSIFVLAVEPGEEYRFASVNAAFGRVTGIPADAVIGKTIDEIIPEPSRAMVKEKYRQAIREKTIVRWEEVSAYPTGHLIGEVSVAPIFDPSGRCTHLVGSVHDITERKNAEDRLIEAHDSLEQKVAERTRELSEANLHLQELDRLKSLFIASMSHELRTPLNSIIGFTGIMARGLAGEINPEQKKQLGMVQDSARHLLALINDVIDISKIEAEMIEVGISTFDLGDLLREVETTYRSDAEERGLELSIEVPDLGAVTSDQRRIKQVIMNLVSNALKFTDTGSVAVTAERTGDEMKVTVRDTGIGIGEEDLGQLFRPFGRVAVPGRLTEGTGLGLYLSQKLARLLGGVISVESEPGCGSIFTFTFPAIYQEHENP